VNALLALFDRIAYAVLTVFPAQWDDAHDVFDEEDAVWHRSFLYDD